MDLISFRTFGSVLWLSSLATGFLAVTQQQVETNSEFQRRQETWRKDIESSLTKDEGWLSVAGLVWLHEGVNSIGVAKANGVVLPNGAGADQLGTLSLLGGQVTFSTASGVKSTLNGEKINSKVLQPDSDRILTGSIKWMVIIRGSRVGIRIFDLESRARKEFKGCHWYPADLKFRIVARYVPYTKPRSMDITNVLGDTAPVQNPGYVEFQLGGKTCRLEAQSAGNGLFFNFRDATTGKTTYAAGRFLDADAPVEGKVVLDFNQAVNPPCAFTAYATCPLPPKAKYLDVAIPAGEKAHHPVK